MRLRAKILALVVAALVLTVAVLYVVAETVLKHSYENLELTLARADIARVRNAFAQQATALTRTALDWATWDETYRFMADGNAEYVRAHLGDTALQNLRVNLLLFLRADGHVVQAKHLGLAEALTGETSAWLAAKLKPDLALPNAIDQPQFQGLLSLPQADLLFAAVPVHKSDGAGDANGYLIVARVVDDALVAELARVTNLRFTVERVRAGRAKGIAADVLAALTPATPDLLRPTSANELEAYVLFPDFRGEPGFVARIAENRAVAAQGTQTIRVFLTVIGSVGVAAILLAAFLLDRLVLSRLLQLKREIDVVTSTGDSTRRLTPNGDDEIGGLATATNAMLGSIAKAEAARRESERQLEVRAGELHTAAEHIQHLQDLLPICVRCRRVRDDARYWRQIDEYIRCHAAIEFSHSICPDCHARLADRPPPPGIAERTRKPAADGERPA